MILVNALIELFVAHYVSVLMTLAALTISGAGAYFGFGNYRINRANAAKGPRLSLVAFGDGIASDVYFLLPFDGRTIFAVPLRLVVRNGGSKSAKNVNVLMEISDHAYLHDLPRGTDKVMTARKIVTVADQGRNEHVARIHYHLADIAPGLAIDLTDFIFAKAPTIVSTTVDTTTRDGVPVQVAATVLTAFLVTVTVDGEDIAPLRLRLDIAFRQGEIDRFDAALAAENALIAEAARGRRDYAEKDATFIGFPDFATKVETAEMTIREGNVAAMKAINVRFTAEGLRPRAA